ncbi:MAG: hypothetical protein K8T91_19710 [Planctomycetes bacterium]|nr:hypothetical protein [Planctomycetota bacterium]
MSLLRNLDEFVVGQITFPLTNHLMNRRSVMRKYRALLRSDGLSGDQLNALQLANLQRVLASADRYSPFYTRRFREAGFDHRQMRSVDEIKQLPDLTREVVTEHRREIVDTRQQGAIDGAERSRRPPGQPIPWARFRKHRLVRDASSGSTGSPAIFYEDGSSTAMNWAHELRLKQWFGINPGAGEARFARVASEYLPKDLVLAARWRLWHHLILPGNNLSDADHAMSLRKLVEHRPRVFFGVTSALTGLARYLERENLVSQLPPVELVVTWAGPLHEQERQLLQRVFSAPVSNIYSSRELGHIACVCPAGRLHINEESYLVEIESLRPASSSDQATQNLPGEVIVTPLFELPMPFIRYRTGDIGQWATAECPCGRKQRVIESLLGRSGELFHTEDGRLIAPNFWCHAFMRQGICDDLAEFQVVLRSGGAIRFRIVPRPSYSSQTEKSIRDFVRKNLPPRTKIDFEYVSRIEPHPSGKYQMVVAEAPGLLRGTPFDSTPMVSS